MAKIKVSMSGIGARAILNSPEVEADLLRRAQRIKAAADAKSEPTPSGMKNPNFIAKSGAGKGRVVGVVIAANPYSIASNQKHNTLLKSLDAGR